MAFGDNQVYIAKLLLKNNLIDQVTIDTLTEKSHKKNIGIIDALIEEGNITETKILQILANDLGMEFISLKEIEVEAEAVSKINYEHVYEYEIMPIRVEFDDLVIATHRPLDLNYLDNLRHVLNIHIDCVVATHADIKEAQRKYYENNQQNNNPDNISTQLDDGDIHSALLETAQESEEGGISKDDAPVIRLVSNILSEAMRMRASDIHLEPLEKAYRTRYRIDGVLIETKRHPKVLQLSITSRVKLLAGMKLSEKRLPQDGKIKFRVKKKEVDIRVSSLPGSHGESIVMRILDKSELSIGIPQLGFLSDTEKDWHRLINLPNGVILITGPTGSGKTTTLYSSLHVLNKPERKIITAEDPIEYQLTGINQVQVREDIGFTFSSVLRACLRQAPNILMVGEIRDGETARIAMNAAFTGHLVFSTLHTNDAPGAITRLIDQGIPAFLVASALRAVLAQRLVRKICENCKISLTPSPAEKEMLKLDPTSTQKVFKGEGCEKCNGKGYKGRIGIFELLLLSEKIQTMIFERQSSTDIRNHAIQTGMRTLREDAILKVINGVTTVEEVMRVTKIGEN